MKKSYFIRTFKINNFLIVITILVSCLQLLMKLVGSWIGNMQSGNSEGYSLFLLKGVNVILSGIWDINMACIVLSLILISPEFINRKRKDSLKNLVISIRATKKIQKYLSFHEFEKEEAFKKYNRCIKTSVIDVREQNIIFILKVPNDMTIQKLVLGFKESLRNEIVNQFPDYAVSDFTRQKNYLKLEGTKLGK